MLEQAVGPISKVVISLQRIPEMAVEYGLAGPVIAVFCCESRQTHTYTLVTRRNLVDLLTTKY
jgi:hypothetical protein